MANPIELPLVDISNSHDVAAGKKLLDAAVKHGFLYADSNSTMLTALDVDQTFNLVREYPLRLVPRTGDGLACMLRRWILNITIALNIGEFQEGNLQQPLPPCLVSRESEIARFTSLCNATCIQILRLLALGLEIDEDFFTSRHDQSRGTTGNSLRWLYYPAVVSSYRPGKDIRAGAHSDYGSITLLFQRPGQPGLEILTANNEWAPVPVYPDGRTDFPFPPILVNIGDMLSYWTDGLLKSTVHRVVFSEQDQSDHTSKPRDRYSIAFFCQPMSETDLIPVPSEIVSLYRKEQKGEETGRAFGHGGGARGPNTGQPCMTAGEHLQSRLAATYL
ncbi:hypothetical protein N7508_002703 [Penicillium antarcticum]|uniref:uncharacterized protein n=1 Tax=Penicillium antarcticum TaxID=416450 RepID=UPI002394E782|nr:uncharacterized protein N7508_002703 [Penicillium antarcticum]KAJ5318195.1 hypothetical protein N7508_002703 [Penicillium antarcticum]